MLVTRYFNIMVKDVPIGHISIMTTDDAGYDETVRKMEELFPESFEYHFFMHDGECTDEDDGYTYGHTMRAVECSESDRCMSCEIEDDGEFEHVVDGWMPTLHAEYTINGEYNEWCESYPSWGDAMRDAEEKWAMLPDGFKEAALTKDSRARFWLTAGKTGRIVRDWAEKYVPVDITIPRNKVGIRLRFWNPDHDRKVICHTLLPYSELSREDRFHGVSGVIWDAKSRYSLDRPSLVRRYGKYCVDFKVVPNGRDLVHGGSTGVFDYDGFMPVWTVQNIVPYLPHIEYSNEWTSGYLMFVDDGELDRALEANKDWLAHMDVKVTRLEDTMRARPDVFEGTYLGDVWVWEHTY